MKKAILLVLLAVLVQSCKDDISCESCQTPFLTGRIQWTGSLLNGGCDWVVSIDNVGQFHAINLPESYQKDSLKIKIRYESMTQRFACSNSSSSYPYIRILSIQ